MAAPKKNPKSAAQKAAEANLTRAQQIALAQQGARVKSASKGAFGARKLRSGGVEMQQYALDRFKNDPGLFNGLGDVPRGPSSPSPDAGRGRNSGNGNKSEPDKPPRGPSRGGKGGDRPGADLNRGNKNRKPKGGVGSGGSKSKATDYEARREAEAARQAELKRKREAAAKKRKADQDAGRGVYKPPTGGGTTKS